MRMNLFRWLLVPMVVLAACTKPDPEPTPEPEPVPAGVFDDTVKGTVKFTSEPKFTFPGEGDQKALVFTVDCNWKVTVPEDVDWITVDPASGDGSSKRQTTSLSVTANPDSKTRKATLTFHAGATKEKISISQDGCVRVIDKSSVPDLDRIYIPQELRSMDLFRSDSRWFFGRSRQSEHFIVFWELGYDPYGETTPGDLPSSNSYYVDIDDLLEKAEEFYRVNVDVLKFADTGHGVSNLDDYKMEIYLLHQTEWLATGGGYDDTIGALWINPATCHPVGSTIAHEIGHSFQYQVYADAVRGGAPNDFSTGWRYEIGQGCGFWEQSAQWQSYQSYAAQAFSTVNFTEFVNNSHRHFTHEHQRYASYFLMWHWASKHGVEEIGELWRASRKPEDPIQTYQRRHSLTMDQLNADLYDYAARCVTWDFSVEATDLYEGKLTGVTQSVREFGAPYIGKIGWTGTLDEATGFYTVDPGRAPEATGFNHIRLNKAEGPVSVRFEGLPNASGFNRVSDPSIAGWNVGFVGLKADGTRVYSPSTRVRDAADISFDVPSGCEKLWLVVAATPERYLQHLWDEDNTNDEVWPFRVRFEGTNLFGARDDSWPAEPQNTVIERNVTTSASAGYGGTSLDLDDDAVMEIGKALCLAPNDIVAALTTDFNNVKTSDVKFVAIRPDGSVDDAFLTMSADDYYSANNFGFWFDAEGGRSTWSASCLYLEHTPSSWSFQFGVHPDKVKAKALNPGDRYTIQVAYLYAGVTATLKFNVTITD